MNTAVVTAIGSGSSKTVINSLHKMGFTVVGTNYHTKELVAEAYMVDCFYNVPTAHSKNYISTLLNILNTENADYLIPLTDIEIDVINMNRSVIDTVGTTLCISGQESILNCRNKKKCRSFLESNGIPRDNLIDIITPDDIDNGYPFPLICKPVNGRSSQGITRIHNMQEWMWYKSLVKSDMIVQPLVEGLIICVDVIRNKMTGQTEVMPRKEYLRTQSGAGLSVCVFNDEKLSDLCHNIADLLEINGCVNFEFILDNAGNYRFLECNPRFSGGVGFSYAAGYDFVKNHMTLFDNNSAKLETMVEYGTIYMAKYYEEMITCST